MVKKIKSLHLVKEKDLKEEFDNFFESTENVDPDNFIIKNVCLMGRKESLNNRVYSDKAMDSLVTFSEGTRCFINHISKDEAKARGGVRDLRDWCGVFENASRKGDAVFANLKVREEYFDLFKDLATMKPNGIGHSIDARVKVAHDSATGMESIVDIARLNSCDIVASPAMTNNLWESIDDTINKNLKDLPEVLVSEEYIELKIEKIFSEAITSEGLIQNELSKEKIRGEINDITYTANDMIRGVLYNGEMAIKDKKSKINNIFDDLGKEVAKRLKGIKETMEADNMEFTLEDVKQNKEIMEALMKDMTEKENVKKTETDLKEAIEYCTAVIDELTSISEAVVIANDSVSYVTDACKEAEKERDEYKVKVDDYEVTQNVKDKKTYIEAMVEEAKLPTEAKTEVFMDTLMKENEVEPIQKLIADRKDLLVSDGKVKGNGSEFILKEKKKVIESQEDLEKAGDEFLSQYK